MKLILIRHGETDANINNIFQGKMETNLNENGKKQVREAGKELKKKYKKIDMIFCSPLKRCMETLDLILTQIKFDGQIFMSNLIEERDFGEYEGSVWRNGKDWEKINADNKENREMGVESLENLRKRSELFLEDLKLEDNDLTVLVVSHGGPIRAMVAKLTKKNPEEIMINNAEIIEFDYKTESEI